MTVVGLGIIGYSLWMLKKWQIHQLYLLQCGAPPQPWFMYILLTMGIVLCFTTLIGHVAVETGSGLSLCIYIFLVTLLLVIQGGTFLYVFLKKNWEDYIPEDSTGQLNQFKEFIKHNISICKCIGFIAILVQALTIILAFILRALGPESDSESTDGYDHLRLDIKQSFLVNSFSQLNSHPRLPIWSNVSSNGTHQYEVEEANFLASQAEQRNPFLNGSQEEQ